MEAPFSQCDSTKQGWVQLLPAGHSFPNKPWKYLQLHPSFRKPQQGSPDAIGAEHKFQQSCGQCGLSGQSRGLSVTEIPPTSTWLSYDSGHLQSGVQVLNLGVSVLRDQRHDF